MENPVSGPWRQHVPEAQRRRTTLLRVCTVFHVKALLAHLPSPPPKEHNSWHAVGSPCPFLPFEIGLFHAFMRFKFTISNYYHQLSLASFTSPCMCLYINMCTHMFYIYTWYIHVCTYAHIRKCTYTHKYIIRTYVFQLLHMYLFGRMVSLHCCIFLFGNLL